VDAQTHPYISTGLKENKFGISMDDALKTYRLAAGMNNIEVVGMDCHIGSQLTELSPFKDALQKLLDLIDQLAELNIHIKHLDVGGGLGVTYQDEQPPQPEHYAKALLEMLKGRDELTLIFEPGRAIMANAGVLLTKVELLKRTEAKNFAIVDAAMNDLLRPALYQAWQDILPVNIRDAEQIALWDVVGPICETGDFLGKARELAIVENDLLAVRSAGAYGFVMASNYNSRPRAAEVMIDKDKAHLVREREKVKNLWQGERTLP
jgi:diaminopimelate decarboxylase